MKVDVNLINNATFILNIDDKVKLGFDPMLAPRGSSIGFGIHSLNKSDIQ